MRAGSGCQQFLTADYPAALDQRESQFLLWKAGNKGRKICQITNSLLCIHCDSLNAEWSKEMGEDEKMKNVEHKQDLEKSRHAQSGP